MLRTLLSSFLCQLRRVCIRFLGSPCNSSALFKSNILQSCGSRLEAGCPGPHPSGTVMPIAFYCWQILFFFSEINIDKERYAQDYYLRLPVMTNSCGSHSATRRCVNQNCPVRVTNLWHREQGLQVRAHLWNLLHCFFLCSHTQTIPFVCLSRSIIASLQHRGFLHSSRGSHIFLYLIERIETLYVFFWL